MKKILTISSLSLTSLLLTAGSARAFCPVCTVAAASAVGLSRWLGVDDVISGLWVGGVTVSMIGWTINWLAKKEISAWYWSFLTAILYFGLILIPFYKMNLISFHPANSLWGVDKLLLGFIIGSIVFQLSHMLYLYVKKRNGGHAHFPYEKIAFPVGSLIILSGIFYFITK